MKKTMKILALVLSLAMLAVLFASCAPSGEYSAGDLSFKFGVNKMKITYSDFTFEAEYTIEKDDEGNQTIDIELADLEEDASSLKSIAYIAVTAALAGERSYETGKNDDGVKYVSIGGIQYTKE